ncbi:MAG TPA: CDP-diacylglycerol--glycerol-3-phosphate 3-phosphatidyltransferase [Clostridiaceae bacterium]|nr:CDP-diacylglycerol--glycerol-3-phosphate 3-phosphatidyltransferase [Clostridiaceae bacterium]
MKYIPNAITLLRLLMVPFFAFVYFSEMPNAQVYALALFLAAGFTDVLDGYIARKYDAVSVVGIVFDPLADKLMLLTALACLTFNGVIPLWTLAVMLVVEGVLILAGIYLYLNDKKDVVPAGKLGKAATVLFAAAVSMMILIPDNPATWIVFWAALAAKVASFFNYAKGFVKRSGSEDKKKM